MTSEFDLENLHDAEWALVAPFVVHGLRPNTSNEVIRQRIAQYIDSLPDDKREALKERILILASDISQDRRFEDK